MRQMTEMSQKKMTVMFQRKKTAPNASLATSKATVSLLSSS